MRHLIAPLFCAALLQSGCATLYASGPSHLSVAVEEPQRGVEVLVTDLSSGEDFRREVPFFTLKLDRRTDYRMRVSHPDYTAQSMTIGRTLHPMAYYDVAGVLLGLTGTAVGYSIASTSQPVNGLGGLVLVGFSNILTAFGLASLGVDAMTGNIWRHAPDEITVRLKKE